MKAYDEVKKTVFAKCTIPNGYFGETQVVGVALIGERTVFVADCGYFRAPIGEVASKEEALWMLGHHPAAKNITNIKLI